MLDDFSPSVDEPQTPDVAAVLVRLDRRKLETFAAVAVDLLDFFDQPSDPDAPDFSPADDGAPGSPDDAEPDRDEKDAAWIEWHTMRGASKRGPNIAGWSEDDEDDDAAEEDDGGGDVVTEDEPGFDPLSRAVANAIGADGPGGGALLDPDCEDGI